MGIHAKSEARGYPSIYAATQRSGCRSVLVLQPTPAIALLRGSRVVLSSEWNQFYTE